MFVAVICWIATLHQVCLQELLLKYLPASTQTHIHTHPGCPPFKLCESADQTPGCAQTYSSLCTVVLDLGLCPYAPDACEKLNYRLVAPSPKRGLFSWLYSEMRSFSHSGIGKGGNVVGIKRESASLGRYFCILWASDAQMLKSLQRLLNLIVRGDRCPEEIGFWAA